MKKLLKGIVQFRETSLPEYAEHFRRLSQGQSPDALFITCSDSRVVPELLASTDPGDLFVVRNVGNMVPPATVNGDSIGDLSEASAIEYCVLRLKIDDIIVCGHSSCGAMKAALDPERVNSHSNLSKWLHHTTSARFRLDQEGPLDARLPVYDQLSQLNVLVQLEHLMTYTIVDREVRAGRLRLNGWWFDIASGEMSLFDRASRSFQPIDRATATRVIEQLETPKS